MAASSSEQSQGAKIFPSFSLKPAVDPLLKCGRVKTISHTCSLSGSLAEIKGEEKVKETGLTADCMPVAYYLTRVEHVSPFRQPGRRDTMITICPNKKMQHEI